MHIVVAFLLGTALMAGFNTLHEQPEGHFYTVPDAEERVLLHTYMETAEEMKERHLVMQEKDYSCGAATLATLLNYHLGENFSEEQVIHGLFTYGDVEAIEKRRAFSMLDMKRFVDALGYEGRGFRAEMEDLEDLEVPVVLPIELFGYQHFVVFRGIENGRVFLADPWRGHSTYTREAFKDMWYEDVLFMIDPQKRHTLSLLSLTRKDMRYITPQEERWMLFPPDSTRISVPRKRRHKYLDQDGESYKR